MQPHHISLLKTSFAEILPIRDAAARLFYERLFELDPSLEPLFAGTDLASQGRKLMSALAMVVAGLERPGTLLPKVEALAVRHLAYGVEESHYATVGQALLDTLAKGLGAGFTAQVREAWSAAFALLSGVMIATSYPRQSAE
ncbi:hemin receptor [Bosea sp. F3-2]|uniref:globin family protein n=1 Tax=Bosea sp. F3-2 TaxID=2599640 RepID=UPI0011ED2C76|nr:globin family protein [Bosea sp. F3-2]QEL24757.1 hemin receptor [Bosea sp. F3-2]